MFRLEAQNVTIRYGEKIILDNFSIGLERNVTTALIGPPDAGKSRVLRLFNRMLENEPDIVLSGNVLFDGINIYQNNISACELRQKICLLLSQPALFPYTIADNFRFALKIAKRMAANLEEVVERALYAVGIWEEVKDKIYQKPKGLSLYQQQMLCLARLVALEPSVLLLEQPTFYLDARSTMRFEETLENLKKDYTILLATHSPQQAGRVSERTAFLLDGKLIEYDTTRRIFTHPSQTETLKFLTGRYD